MGDEKGKDGKSPVLAVSSSTKRLGDAALYLLVAIMFIWYVG